MLRSETVWADQDLIPPDLLMTSAAALLAAMTKEPERMMSLLFPENTFVYSAKPPSVEDFCPFPSVSYHLKMTTAEIFIRMSLQLLRHVSTGALKGQTKHGLSAFSEPRGGFESR